MRGGYHKLFLALACMASVSYHGGMTSAVAGGDWVPLPVKSDKAVIPVVDDDATERLIIKFKHDAGTAVARADATTLARMSALAGKNLKFLRSMSGGAQVLQLPSKMSVLEVDAMAKRLAADDAVDYAVPDRRKKPLLVPNDARYAEQWHYMSPSVEPGAANLPAAWDMTTGAAGIVVAVIDTGLRPHADIDSNILDASGRVVAGYDFIADLSTANDGNGRDSDPTDPGDGTDSVSDPSSWHGTHVAGTIGALTNNGTGVAGINWVSKIQPVRVLGVGGGWDSDIIDAIRWSAGGTVSGVPANATPAKVLNLSLGGSGACDSATQSAINDAVALGATVVVAAGNSNDNAANYSPASCNNVITVAAVGRYGQRADYSNYGSTVEIAAPGGDKRYSNPSGIDADAVLSTLNTGLTTPGSDSYAFYQGTSMATPHVAGIVSLMLSVNSSLTPAQVLSILQGTARAFPTNTSRNCTTSICGAGLIDAANAVAASDPSHPGLIGFTTNAATVSEGGTLVATVKRFGSNGAVTVNYATSNATATAGADYTAVSGILSWANGDSSSRTINVPVLADAVNDGGEAFYLTLSSPTGGATLGTSGMAIAITEPFPAGGVMPPGWATAPGATAGWSVASDYAYEGTYSLKSNDILDSQTAAVQASYTFGATGGYISFVRRVDSESNYDYLKFYIDGVQAGEWSGYQEWSWISEPVGAGTHTFKWEYSKDSSLSYGADAAWIDAVTFVNNVSAYALTVSMAGTGSGTVVSSPAGISCGLDCSETYLSGTSVTLTATPAVGSYFTGWSGGGCGGLGACTVSVTSNTAITATFSTTPPVIAPPPYDYNADSKSDVIWRNGTTGDLILWQMNGTGSQSIKSFGTVATAWQLKEANADYNGDGKKDLLWRRSDTGETSLWLMNGTGTPTFKSFGPVALDWQLVETNADYNGDGNMDLLWRRTSNGELSLWLINGSSAPTFKGFGVIPTTWQIQTSTADYNADGKADLLWRRTDTGDTSLWLMNGASSPTFKGFGVVALDWQLARIGSDFNADGKADLLWRRASNGELTLWQMNGASTPAFKGFGILSTDWWLRPMQADYNGDGKNDLLWRRAGTGELSMWQMNGTGAPSFKSFGVVAEVWAIEDSGSDYNADGKSDILWRNTSTGDTTLWLVNGTGSQTVKGFGTVATSWAIEDTRADYNGDGMADVLWRNGSTAEVYLWQMNGSGPYAGKSFGAVSSSWSMVSQD